MMDESRVCMVGVQRKCTVQILDRERSVDVFLRHSDVHFRNAVGSIDVEHIIMHGMLYERMMEEIRSAK